MSKDNLVNLNEFLRDRIDYGELFVECLRTVSDDLSVYAIKGGIYKVIDVDENLLTIDGEDCANRLKRNNVNFRIFIKKGGS